MAEAVICDVCNKAAPLREEECTDQRHNAVAGILGLGQPVEVEPHTHMVPPEEWFGIRSGVKGADSQMVCSLACGVKAMQGYLNQLAPEFHVTDEAIEELLKGETP